MRFVPTPLQRAMAQQAARFEKGIATLALLTGIDSAEIRAEVLSYGRSSTAPILVVLDRYIVHARSTGELLGK